MQSFSEVVKTLLHYPDAAYRVSNRAKNIARVREIRARGNIFFRSSEDIAPLTPTRSKSSTAHWHCQSFFWRGELNYLAEEAEEAEEDKEDEDDGEDEEAKRERELDKTRRRSGTPQRSSQTFLARAPPPLCISRINKI